MLFSCARAEQLHRTDTACDAHSNGAGESWHPVQTCVRRRRCSCSIGTCTFVTIQCTLTLRQALLSSKCASFNYERHAFTLLVGCAYLTMCKVGDQHKAFMQPALVRMDWHLCSCVQQKKDLNRLLGAACRCQHPAWTSPATIEQSSAAMQQSVGSLCCTWSTCTSMACLRLTRSMTA